MVSIFILLNIDILIFSVKKDLEKSYKINCEYDIRPQGLVCVQGTQGDEIGRHFGLQGKFDGFDIVRAGLGRDCF